MGPPCVLETTEQAEGCARPASPASVIKQKNKSDDIGQGYTVPDSCLGFRRILTGQKTDDFYYYYFFHVEGCFKKITEMTSINSCVRTIVDVRISLKRY